MVRLWWADATKNALSSYSRIHPCLLCGVEHVFSAAGKMHGDLQKSVKDSTLEHSLFAAYNTD